MRVGILEAGRPPGDLEGRFGRYDAMVGRLLGPDCETRSFAVAAGVLPERPESCDAYVITGSSAGVYDLLPWIEPLTSFLRQAKGRAKLVGICFGHQIMAGAFGGEVVKSEKGWGLGLHDYAVRRRAPWMTGAHTTIRVPVSHQDQVVACPPGARVIAGSDFTPFGILAYDDQPAISFQCHPEFEPDFSRALIASRRGHVADARLDAANSSLAGFDDRESLAGWIRGFLGA